MGGSEKVQKSAYIICSICTQENYFYTCLFDQTSNLNFEIRICQKICNRVIKWLDLTCIRRYLHRKFVFTINSIHYCFQVSIFFLLKIIILAYFSTRLTLHSLHSETFFISPLIMTFSNELLILLTNFAVKKLRNVGTTCEK